MVISGYEKAADNNFVCAVREGGGRGCGAGTGGGEAVLSVPVWS